jgi:hypothetical protein
VKIAFILARGGTKRIKPGLFIGPFVVSLSNHTHRKNEPFYSPGEGMLANHIVSSLMDNLG